MPVAWMVLKATEKHAGRKEWLRLLRIMGGAIPKDRTVIV